MKSLFRMLINIAGIAVITLGLVFMLQHMRINTTTALDTYNGQAHGEYSEEQNLKTQVDEHTRDPNRLWCNEHNVYEDECVICHPEIATKKSSEKRDPNRLWCNEHNVYEDECVICHPEIASKKSSEKRDPNRLWCNEHNVYEDECMICHPEIAKQKDDGHKETAAGLFCGTHQLLEKECGICQPQLAQQLKPGESMKVRLASMNAVQKGGIETGKPILGSLPTNKTFLSEVRFNENQYAHISPLADGVIQKVYANLGDTVEKGQVLLEVASNEVAKAKSDYLKSLDQLRLKEITYMREKELAEKNISAQQEFQQAEAEYQVAKTESMTCRQQLLNYGLTQQDIEFVKNNRDSTSTLKVRAPFDGTLTDKHAVLGEAVEAGESVFQLADLSTLWLELSIPESEIPHVKTGDPIHAEFNALPGTEVKGEITWISPIIDENSRMLKARAVIPNPEGKLKQGLFGRVHIVRNSNQERLIVPSGSVQKVDGKPFVFVKQGDDLFELRHIALGNKSNGQMEIAGGLSPEDEIVIANSFVMKSEFLKSRFGAGCTHD